MTTASSTSDSAALARTPLHALHQRLDGRMVAFAGYDMPVSYPAGLVAEHRQCRESAALFDVSHMGQIRVAGRDAALALERLLPADLLGCAVGRMRYSFLLDDDAGILDDLMVCRRGDEDFLLVVNAANKDADRQLLQEALSRETACEPMPDQALLALQGPLAAMALARLDSGVQRLAFMHGAPFTLAGAPCFVMRSGYTGEDGFEVSVPADRAEALAEALLALPEVGPAGLGARDTLRLEAGLCLHGQDITPATTPVEADLAWALPKVRREGGARAGGHPGANVIARQLRDGPPRKRVGLVALDRVPVRAGAPLVDHHGHAIGQVTSGTLMPSQPRPVAMGYVDTPLASVGSRLHAEVRGKPVPMEVVALPFSAHRYHRG
jgi:aminomethyltransferase